MKYQIIVLDASGGGARSVTLSAALIVGILASVLILVFSFVVNLSRLSAARARAKFSQTLLLEQQSESALIHKDFEHACSSGVSALQKNDLFFAGIFDDDSMMSRYYTKTDVIDGFVSTKQISADNIEEIAGELNSRVERYREIEHYLQMRHLVERHTPNVWPSHSKRATSSFGFRRSPFTGIPSYHEGTDCISSMGAPVFATADGVVVYAGVRTGYGYLVTIDHGFGYMTRYAHNSRLLVWAGMAVQKGDVVSLSGSTGRSAGPHLHYEVLFNGMPVNSEKYLPDSEGRITKPTGFIFN
ncbi:hypothetical protein RsTz2092_07850 [Deferribacterales bacterium RsTz2092]|nr:hypothetical protein AGMMS49941_05200 [Deferribacterales bacterium]